MNLRKTSLLLMSFLFLTAILYSCKRTKYAKEIASLDSLQTILSKADSTLNSIDTAKTNAYYLDAKNNLNYIQNNYKDTMERELAIFLSDYRSILESLESFNSERNQLLKELNYSQKQIENLIHDLKNNAVEKTKITEYYNTEIEAANELLPSVNAMVDMAKKQLTDYEQKNKRVLEIVNGLKQKER